MDKKIKSYKKIYRKALEKAGLGDIDAKVEAFAARLSEMYSSDNFKKHNVYPSTSTPHVNAVIAMCLELKEFLMLDGLHMGYLLKKMLIHTLIVKIRLL